MQKHLDTSTIRHAGQDGRGPDKSMATTLPYTQMGTPSSIASFLATLVAEARAELRLPPELPVPSLADVTAATVARARAELAADAREIERGNALGIDFDFVRRIGFANRTAFIDGNESAIGRAYPTGLIGAIKQKSGGYLRLGKPITTVAARFAPKPDKPRKQKCLKPQWGEGTDGYGWSYKMWHRCNQCVNCIAFTLNMKAWRWDVGRGPFQTSIMVQGAANADEARKWTGLFDKAIHIPNRSSLVTPDGEIWIVSADPLDADTIQRIRDFAAAKHGNCKRPAMHCTIKSENVKGSDLAAFVKGNRTAQGEQRHVSFRLHGAAFADDRVEDDFSLGDATPIPDDEPTPTAVVLSPEVKKSRSWRKERNPAKRETLRIAARAEQARLWCDGKTILTYTGPTKMLKQHMDFMAGRREYEPAWDIVARLYGGFEHGDETQGQGQRGKWQGQS